MQVDLFERNFAFSDQNTRSNYDYTTFLPVCHLDLYAVIFQGAIDA